MESNPLIVVNLEQLQIMIDIAVNKSISGIQFNNTNETHSKTEKLLTKEELANEFGVSIVTITNWMKKGLPFKRFRRRVYFDKAQILTIMDRKAKIK